MRGDLELIGNETLLQLGMTAGEQREFLAQMASVRKSRVCAAWLAALLGGLGAHHFYLEQPERAWRYVLFCWTGIPTLLGIWELRTLGQRVDRYNAVRARAIAKRVRGRGAPEDGEVRKRRGAAARACPSP